jgi:hypothetical protein
MKELVIPMEKLNLQLKTIRIEEIPGVKIKRNKSSNNVFRKQRKLLILGESGISNLRYYEQMAKNTILREVWESKIKLEMRDFF